MKNILFLLIALSAILITGTAFGTAHADIVNVTQCEPTEPEPTPSCVNLNIDKITADKKMSKLYKLFDNNDKTSGKTKKSDTDFNVILKDDNVTVSNLVIKLKAYKKNADITVSGKDYQLPKKKTTTLNITTDSTKFTIEKKKTKIYEVDLYGYVGNPPSPENKIPVANDQDVSTKVNKSLTFNLQVTDENVNGLTFVLVDNVKNGTLVLGKQTVYTPNADFNGTDSFSYKVNDGEFDSDVATVTINITSEPIPEPTDNDIALVQVGNTLTGNFNQSKIYRLCAVGDVDSSQSGQEQQIALFQTLNCDWAVVIGDFGYNGETAANELLSYVTNNGFKGNATIVTGNHDIFGNDCPNVKDYMNTNVCYSKANDKNGYLFIVGMDANNVDSFASGSTQFNFVKDQLEGSDGHFNVVAIHQPFVTAKSKHTNNGQFGTYQNVFTNNGVKLVLEAHNHNFQHFEIDGITYLLVGTGRHDTGSNLYSIDSNNDGQGHDLIKGIDNKNGIGVVDFMFHSTTVGKDLNGYFVDDTGKVLYNFIS